ALNLAIGPEDGWLPFYRVTPAAPGEDVPAWYDKVGSFDRDLIVDLARLWAPIADRIEATEVECVTVATLLDRYPIGDPDLVHIDAEGFDGQILGQIHELGLRPGLLFYEHAHLADETESTAERLRSSGYSLFVEGMDTLAVHDRLLQDSSTPLTRAFREATA
ncbi:MAG: FkbM family methyltransferase, partial [Acidimicrobiales bacterium]|nr:FkbM family methyltransferase [Acidimicrobiales bacterium]